MHAGRDPDLVADTVADTVTDAVAHPDTGAHARADTGSDGRADAGADAEPIGEHHPPAAALELGHRRPVAALVAPAGPHLPDARMVRQRLAHRASQRPGPRPVDDCDR